MIYLVIVFSLLSIVLEGQIGTSSDGVDSSKGWKACCLLGRFLAWGGGGGGLFGSIFGWDVCEFAVGYVICKGGGG
jgi:hypothetical protein